MPTLSVTIIAKNEERTLPRALASVRELADEIIIVDTGSTDRTLEIANQFNAEWSDLNGSTTFRRPTTTAIVWRRAIGYSCSTATKNCYPKAATN